MIELKMSNGEYLTHEDLEKYLNEYEEFYKQKFNEGIPKFEWELLVEQGNNEIERSVSSFDKIELIVKDINFSKSFYLGYFRLNKGWGNKIDDSIPVAIKLRGEEIVLFDPFPNNKYEESVSNIYDIEFEDLKINNPFKYPEGEDELYPFTVPNIDFLKYDIEKPVNLKKGSRLLFNVNVVKKRKFNKKFHINEITYVETNGVFSNLVLLPNKSNSSCFVVTATMGDINHPVVNDFRTYRDNVLIDTFLGRLFITFYYKIGPTLAKMIKSNHFLLNTSRKLVLYLHAKIK